MLWHCEIPLHIIITENGWIILRPLTSNSLGSILLEISCQKHCP